MSEALSPAQTEELHDILRRQHARLRDEVRTELRESGQDQYLYMTEGAHDTGDASVADQLAELNLDLLDRHIQALREVEAALARIDTGDYGFCSEDEEPIGYQRLKANPTARRCIACQERFERTHAQPGHHTL